MIHITRLIIFCTALLSCNAYTAVLPCETSKSDCTFVLLSSDGTLTIHNEKRANQRFSPFSTFKIPNSVIALDTGVIKDLAQTMSADTSKYPPQNWWPKSWTADSHTLRSAYQVSAVPIYREIATLIGKEKMEQYLAEFKYGNQDIRAGLDLFWLGVSMKISAVEQVQFLKKLFEQQFSLKPKTYELLKPLTLNNDESSHVFYGKTGAGTLGPNYAEGWFVGVLAYQDKYHYFAVHTEAESFKAVQPKRKEIARQYLAYYDLPHNIK